MSKKRPMDIVQALKHPDLLGGLPVFKKLATWSKWIVFLKAIYGLPMDRGEVETFKFHTGRSSYNPPKGGFPESVCAVGVQSGKSRIAGALSGHAVLTGEPGTHALLIGQDHRGAMRVLLNYAREPFETLDLFRAEVVRSTADLLELKNGVSLSAYPCRPEAPRGIRACIVVIDEFAFFLATDGRPTDQEMLRVARGRVATTGGKIVIISSPYAQAGALWELYRKHYGRDDSPVLVWQATAPQMNPTLPKDYLERMEADDPEAYRSEVLGEFRAGISTFLDPAIVTESVDVGIRERTPGQDHVAFADAASGTGKDQFTVGIAHREGDTAVLDCIRGWAPPFNPSGVIAEISDLLKRYGVSRINGDKYAPGFVEEHFRINNITYQYSDLDRSGIYMELLPMLNSGRVRLLDVPELLRELRGLERRRGTSGRDRIDHRPGQHDDLANSAGGSLVFASRPSRVPGVFVF